MSEPVVAVLRITRKVGKEIWDKQLKDRRWEKYFEIEPLMEKEKKQDPVLERRAV